MNRFFYDQRYTDYSTEINYPSIEETKPCQENEAIEKIKTASTVDEVAKIMGDALADSIIRQIKE